MRNRYIFRSHISEKKFRELIRLFSLDIEASKISVFTGISRKTINKILHAIRVRLAELCEEQAIFSQGVFECDESYFGARRIRGKRGRGAAGKIIVFGIYERHTGRVYTCIVPNVKSQTLIEIRVLCWGYSFLYCHLQSTAGLHENNQGNLQRRNICL